MDSVLLSRWWQWVFVFLGVEVEVNSEFLGIISKPCSTLESDFL